MFNFNAIWEVARDLRRFNLENSPGEGTATNASVSISEYHYSPFRQFPDLLEKENSFILISKGIEQSKTRTNRGSCYAVQWLSISPITPHHDHCVIFEYKTAASGSEMKTERKKEDLIWDQFPSSISTAPPALMRSSFYPSFQLREVNPYWDTKF